MAKDEWEPPYAICGHKKKEARGGGKCQHKAGAGTDHPGYGRCKWHGGTSAANKTHAMRLEAKERLDTLGVALDVKPHFALEAMVQVSAGAVAYEGIAATSGAQNIATPNNAAIITFPKPVRAPAATPAALSM